MASHFDASHKEVTGLYRLAQEGSSGFPRLGSERAMALRKAPSGLSLRGALAGQDPVTGAAGLACCSAGKSR